MTACGYAVTPTQASSSTSTTAPRRRPGVRGLGGTAIRAPTLDEHVKHVFAAMAGTAHRFAAVRCLMQRAVGISVEHDGLVGLFCLAVSPDGSAGTGDRSVTWSRSGCSRCAKPRWLMYRARSSARTPPGEQANSGMIAVLGFREAYRILDTAAAPALERGLT